jgi:putative salt-induced outer membrane protein YdiY
LYSRDGTLIYLESLSNVYSPGGGVDVDLTRHFALKVDAQLQHYNSPISSTGSEWAKAGTIGVVYRLGFKGYRYGH